MRRVGGWVVIALLLLVLAPAARAVVPTAEPLPAKPGAEVESNDVPADATPIASGSRVRGNLATAGDVDYYSFRGTYGLRLYAAAMTDGSAGLTDAQIEVIAPDGSTVLSLGTSEDVTRPSVANVTLLGDGTYYIRVSDPPGQSGAVLPYDLYLQLQGGTTPLETEPNDAANPQPLPGGGWVRGQVNPSDDDYYSLDLQPGDTVFASLNRNAHWPSHVSIRKVGGEPLDVANQALFMTVKDAGTYEIGVTGGDNVVGDGAYRLSVTVIRAEPTSCRAYSSSGPTALADAVDRSQWGTTTSSIDVPDDARIERAALYLDYDHARKGDLSFALQTPAGNDIQLGGLGSPTPGREQLGIDDYAATTPVVAHPGGAVVMPHRDAGRLGFTRGESSAGTWKLVVRDGNPGATGTLNGWRIVLCEAPPPPGPTAAVYGSDFESGDGGFTHSGTADEWQRGRPFGAPIDGCASGSGCWKTDLGGSYDAPSSQDLVSPPISLAGRSGPILLSWAQRFQLGNAEHTHYWVEVRQVGGPGAKRVFEWGGPSMFVDPPAPFPFVQESAGWGTFRADLSEFAGQTIQVRFHLDADPGAEQLRGVAIDDVSVRASGDDEPPDTFVIDTPPGFRSHTAPFFFVSSEPGSTFECSVDGAPFEACSSGFTTPFLADGPHTFDVRAIDASGNVDPTPRHRDFVVDTVPPQIEVGGSRTQPLSSTVSFTVKPANEDILARASGRVLISGVAVPLKLRGLGSHTLTRGSKVTLRMSVPPDVRAQIDAALRRGAKVVAEIRVVAEDFLAGNVTVVKRRIKLVR